LGESPSRRGHLKTAIWLSLRTPWSERWNMLVTIGQPCDSEDDPTILWPNNRKEVRAGTLTLSSAMPGPKAGGYKINLDPLMMADGIEATNDPILLLPI
jgi:catalase